MAVRDEPDPSGSSDASRSVSLSLCLAPLLSPLSLKLKEYLTKNTLRISRASMELPKKLQSLENKELAMILWPDQGGSEERFTLNLLPNSPPKTEPRPQEGPK